MKKDLEKLNTLTLKAMDEEKFEIAAYQQLSAMGFILSEAILLLMEGKSRDKEV